jgi:hypothetical protein
VIVSVTLGFSPFLMLTSTGAVGGIHFHFAIFL